MYTWPHQCYQCYLAASEAPCWSKQGRTQYDENADSDDDNDGYCDIPKVFWCKLKTKKKLPLASTTQGHLSSSKDSCNYPFCLPAPSVFPFPCIRINLGSFILIITYLLNWQSQSRTIENKASFWIWAKAHFYATAPFQRNFIHPK